MVEQSTTVLPGPSTGSMASTTSTTSGELGTHTMTTSDFSATPRGAPPSAAPWATAASIGPRPREATVTSWPGGDEVPRHGQPHGAEADESDAHSVSLQTSRLNSRAG